MTLPRYEPMLATPWPEAFSDDDWVFEEKLDGFRALLYWDGSTVELQSRSGRTVTAQYPELDGFTSPRPCVIDGEIVVFDAAGIARFGLMQQRTGVPGHGSAVLTDYPVSFVAFDVLFCGDELIGLAQEVRREWLEALPLAAPFHRSPQVAGDGLGLWEESERRGGEGIVAKRLGRPYLPGRRAEHWRKIARVARVRAVVGGFTPGGGGRSDSFGSLLVGLWTGEGLRWVGAVGSGFDEQELRAIRAALDEMTVSGCPFLADPGLPEAVWVTPQLVAVVGNKGWTVNGRLRAPRFFGFTLDPPETVTWEAEGPVARD